MDEEIEFRLKAGRDMEMDHGVVRIETVTDTPADTPPHTKRIPKRSDLFVKFINGVGSEMRAPAMRHLETKVVKVGRNGSVQVGKQYSGKVVRLIMVEASDVDKISLGELPDDEPSV